MSAPGPVISTRVARTQEGEHSFCGHELFAELLGHETITGLLWLAAGGARLGGDDVAVLNDAVVAATAADPKVWPLKIARLTASYGGSVAGVAAGLSMLEKAAVGPWNMGEAAHALERLNALVGADTSEAHLQRCARELVERERRVPGFGVPFRTHDERLLALQRVLEARGWLGRHYQRLFRHLADAVRARRGHEPNIGAGMAALFLDLGLPATGASMLAVAVAVPMFVANAAEGAEQRAALLQRLPEQHVQYLGSAPRVSERALLGQARGRER